MVMKRSQGLNTFRYAHVEIRTQTYVISNRLLLYFNVIVMLIIPKLLHIWLEEGKYYMRYNFLIEQDGVIYEGRGWNVGKEQADREEETSIGNKHIIIIVLKCVSGNTLYTFGWHTLYCPIIYDFQTTVNTYFTSPVWYTYRRRDDRWLQ